MKINVDKEKCIGCGACVAACPDVFEMDDDGKSKVKENADLSKCDVNSAINVCPVGAISVEE